MNQLSLIQAKTKHPVLITSTTPCVQQTRKITITNPTFTVDITEKTTGDINHTIDTHSDNHHTIANKATNQNINTGLVGGGCLIHNNATIFST